MHDSKDYRLQIESRLTSQEIRSFGMQEDIKEIKRDLRWLLGTMISINIAILGAIIKGLNLI